MVGEPDDELPRLVSRAEVKAVDYQIEVLAQRIFTLDKELAVTKALHAAELGRHAKDIENLGAATAANETLAPRIDQLAKDVNDIRSNARKGFEQFSATELEWRSAESERRGSRNTVTGILTLISGSIGGAIGAVIAYFLHR